MKIQKTFPALLGLCLATCIRAEEISAIRRFDFTTGEIAPTNLYSPAAGFGFEPGHAEAKILPGRGFTGRQTFSFSVAVSEGNHRVTVTFGDNTGATTNTVKAEARRLMVEKLATAKGEFTTRSFIVNTRTVDFPGGHVKLKAGEKTNEAVTWDDKLTLEFNGARPGVRALEIAPATNVVTVFLAGDSTVCDQRREPWNSWGQMLPLFFDDSVAVANYAESGESIKSSLGAHRFDKINATIRPGDWLFVQFGHNDMKDKAPNALAVYKSNLKKIVAATRAKGASPVLVTSMERKAGVNGPTLAGYPDAVRDVAREDKVALIDLNAMSLKLYAALGPNLDRAFQDGTHHNNYGSYELARCVVTGIRQAKLELVKHLAADAGEFDPARPDPVDKFSVPTSGEISLVKPEGN